jgi:aminoglycoside phosphotransferase (APT) family kinase protein
VSERWTIPRTEAFELFDSVRHAGNDRRGFYNANVVSTWRGSPVVVRFPLHAADRMDLMIWPEERVIRPLAQRTASVPTVLFASSSPRFQIHSFVDGPMLDDVAPRGRTVPSDVALAILELLALLPTVPRAQLPVLPPDWPVDGDSAGVLHRLTAITSEVYSRAADERALMDEFGIPRDPLQPIEERVATLSSRPFALIHADIHRKNIIVSEHGPVILDWELAIVGDPVYEVAVHIHKMGYQADEEQDFLARWARLLSPELTAGWAADLPTYLAHERIKSAIVDSVRYAGVFRNGANAVTRRALLEKLDAKLRAAHAVWGTTPPSASRIAELMTRIEPARTKIL